MKEQYFMPKELSIHIIYTYQGKEIDKIFFDQYPEIHHLFPPKEEVESKHSEVRKHWKPGDRYTIIVSEKKIEVKNGF